MEITTKNQSIKSVPINPFEEAWKIEDVLILLEYYRHNNRIVLGGDILNERFEHTYDNWYYNIDTAQDSLSNLNNSIVKANEYVTRYIEKNGNNYYVSVVIKE